MQVGAAVLGVPVKPTIKEVDSERNVVKTLARAALWEVQTPQVQFDRAHHLIWDAECPHTPLTQEYQQ